MSSGVETSLNISEIVKDSSASVGMTRNRRSQTAATVQSAGTTVPAFQRRVHPANRPTSHPRVEIVLLRHSTPSSNSIDRRFHAPPSVIPAKSKWRLHARTRPAHKEPHRDVALSKSLSPISKELGLR